jgi:hypothetical protein
MSNSGSLSETISEIDMEPINVMISKMKKVKILTRVIPIAFLRKKFIKQSMVHLKGCNEQEQKYMQELFEIMFYRLTNKSERHMCTLMIDLLNLKRFTKNDFAYLDGKVLLILSKDDETFSNKIKKGLIDSMPNPKVCDSLSGGHVALILKIDNYISLIKDFLLTPSKNQIN